MNNRDDAHQLKEIFLARTFEHGTPENFRNTFAKTPSGCAFSEHGKHGDECFAVRIRLRHVVPGYPTCSRRRGAKSPEHFHTTRHLANCRRETGLIRTERFGRLPKRDGYLPVTRGSSPPGWPTVFAGAVSGATTSRRPLIRLRKKSSTDSSLEILWNSPASINIP